MSKNWYCDKCGAELSWYNAVTVMDDSTGQGPITCPFCGADGGWWVGWPHPCQEALEEEETE